MQTKATDNHTDTLLRTLKVSIKTNKQTNPPKHLEQTTFRNQAIWTDCFCP